jgi:8-amino-7-oxononanoate synthase
LIYDAYQKYLKLLRSSGKYRKLFIHGQGNNENLLDFSSNDYLNLSKNPKIIESAAEYLYRDGIGSTGSRLLSGNSEALEEFEGMIADKLKTESALVFSSGFQTNISVLAALLDSKVLGVTPIVFFDKLNHASLYQGVFLSSAELKRYSHNDYNELELLLERYNTTACPKFIVTESLFSMDGDCADISKLADLSRKYNAFLYMDEAHAVGILGKDGYGLTLDNNLNYINYLIMGTFSKALGSSGGYIACNKLVKDYLINKASGFIYSTALPPPIIAAAKKAWSMIPELEVERRKISDLGLYLRSQLADNDFDYGNSVSQIVPVILRDESIVMDIKTKMLENNIVVAAIRPPTVPVNSSRLRISITAKHEIFDINRLVECLVSINDSYLIRNE